MAKATEVAWAAGFFDGEGCTCLIKAESRRGVSLLIHVNQKDRRVLDRFHRAVGRGFVRGPYTHGQGASVRYAFSASRYADVVDIIFTLWPHLDDVKREQAMSAISRYEAAAPAEATECANGHPFPGGRGKQPCRLCARNRKRRFQERKREAV